MIVTDPISDMLNRIRNAAMARHEHTVVPTSKMKLAIARILKEEGFIKNFKVIDDNKQGILNVTLKYSEANQSVITGTRRVSKPGCRIFCTQAAVPKVLDGLGIAIISTSKGIFTGKRCEEERVGGEVLCYIW